MDDLNKAILKRIQDEFPIAESPYEVLAEELGEEADEVYKRVKTLARQGAPWRAESGVIRRLGPVYDLRKLGFVSTLVAMRVSGERIKEVAEIVNSYSGVTHNYQRAHQYNLWFTVIARSQGEISRVLDEIKQRSHIQDLVNLPAEKIYKVDVSFPVAYGDRETLTVNGSSFNDERQTMNIFLDEIDRKIISATQGGLGFSRRPYKEIAQGLGIDVKVLLSRLSALKEKGIVRKNAAILDQRKVGLRGNALVVFDVAGEKLDEAAKVVSSLAEVSHCVGRSRRLKWRYNLYAMVHSRSDEECREVARRIAYGIGAGDFRLLFTLRQFKREPMRYF